MEATQRGHWYEVDVLRGNARLELRIDATSGKVLGSSPVRGEDAHCTHALGSGGKLTFGEAIAQAERAGNGTALEANSSATATTRTWTSMSFRTTANASRTTTCPCAGARARPR